MCTNSLRYTLNKKQLGIFLLNKDWYMKTENKSYCLDYYNRKRILTSEVTIGSLKIGGKNIKR